MYHSRILFSEIGKFSEPFQEQFLEKYRYSKHHAFGAIFEYVRNSSFLLSLSINITVFNSVAKYFVKAQYFLENDIHGVYCTKNFIGFLKKILCLLEHFRKMKKYF